MNIALAYPATKSLDLCLFCGADTQKAQQVGNGQAEMLPTIAHDFRIFLSSPFPTAATAATSV